MLDMSQVKCLGKIYFALQACISLNAMYDEARQRNEAMPNEGEFRAYHLLLLMGTHGKYKYNSTEYRKALKVKCVPREGLPFCYQNHWHNEASTGLSGLYGTKLSFSP